ncbi:unnamed protein product [Brassica oleracea]
MIVFRDGERCGTSSIQRKLTLRILLRPLPSVKILIMILIKRTIRPMVLLKTIRVSWGCSLLTEDSLKRLRKKYDFPRDVEARVPLPEERPWSSPSGWVCLNSLYFSQSNLLFPLPLLLTSYA